MSNDIEDIVALLDGREELLEETNQAPAALRRFVSEQLGALLSLAAFHDVIQSTAQNAERESLIHERIKQLIADGIYA